MRIVSGALPIRRFTVQVCNGEGKHAGQGLLLPDDGGAVVLTCDHIVQELPKNEVYVRLSEEDCTLGEPVLAAYDLENSDPERDLALLRVDGVGVTERPRLFALDPNSYEGSGDGRATGFVHFSTQSFDARIGVPAPYRVKSYTLSAFPLHEATEVRPGISGAPVVFGGGVVGLAHMAQKQSEYTARTAYLVPLSEWTTVWPGLSKLIEPFDPSDRSESWLKLAEMPLSEVPSPATLPAKKRMELRSNPLFVGRETELQRIAQVFKSDPDPVGGTQTPTVVVHGIGGVGKTQFATEFVHRYGQYFTGGVFWLTFRDSAGIPAEIADCGGPGALGLSERFGDLELDVQVRMVRSAWSNEEPRLLIFDNCEDPALLKWRPVTGESRILVTSRNPTWNPVLGVERIALGTLPPERSEELLHKHLVGRPDDLTSPKVVEIAGELGHLPLALHLSGAFLRRYKDVELDRYLGELRDLNPLDHPALQAADPDPTGNEYNVARTFLISVERLNPGSDVDSLSIALLSCAAYLAPGVSIPLRLLFACLDNSAEDDYACHDALARLVELGLLEESTDRAVRIHRLLAQFVRASTLFGAAQRMVEVAMRSLMDMANASGVPDQLTPVVEHGRLVTNRAIDREDRIAADLCNAFGFYLNSTVDRAGARPYFERALAIREAILGADHPDTASSLNNLGALLREQGDYAGARPYYERALAIREAVLGADHPDTAMSLNNLGALLREQGDYAGARPYYERALAINEAVLGADHPTTATSLNNLGYLLREQGDYAGARPYYERALAIREAVLGADHPDTAMSLNNLGALLREQGDYAGARPYYERALEINEAVLGADHPTTATSLNNLGALLQTQGDYAGARPYYERALAIREAVLGADHPDTAMSLNNLGALLQTQGDYAGARPYHERALAIREAVLGADHPETAVSLNNLGALVDAQGDYAGARPYYERALEINETVLGADHPNTALTLNNLGALVDAQGDYVGARRYYERALAIFTARLGPEHPHTIGVYRNILLLDSRLE